MHYLEYDDDNIHTQCPKCKKWYSCKCDVESTTSENLPGVYIELPLSPEAEHEDNSELHAEAHVPVG